MVGAATLRAMTVRQAASECPRAAYMAPMGWQVLAGFMVKALRWLISFGVCRSNMNRSFLDGSVAGVFGRQFGVFLPGCFEILPDLAVDHTVNLSVEIDGSPEAGVRTAGIVAVELLHGDALLLYGEFFLDACTENGRFVDFDEPFGFVLADVVDHQSALDGISRIIPS